MLVSVPAETASVSVSATPVNVFRSSWNLNSASLRTSTVGDAWLDAFIYPLANTRPPESAVADIVY